MLSRAFAVSLLLLLLAPAGAADPPPVRSSPPETTAPSAAPSPAQVVDRFHQALIEAMRAGEREPYQGRYDRLKPTVTRCFHFPYIARAVLGSHWRGLDKEERATFVRTISRYTIATYASRFRDYSGERFEMLAVEEPRQDLRVVKYVFTDGAGEQRNFDYQLLWLKDRWRLVNIIVDGVSDLSLKRSQYGEVIERHGFRDLVARLDAKTESLAVARHDS